MRYCYDVKFETRVEAEEVLTQMMKVIEDYGFVTVADMHDLSSTRASYTDENYGWSDISNGEIVDIGGYYVLKLPDVELNDVCRKENTIGDDYNMVNHPDHYISETGMEVIDVIEAFTFDLKGIEATDTGNIIKYICRWKNKNGLQDLKKAQWYINHLIDHVEKTEKENK